LLSAVVLIIPTGIAHAQQATKPLDRFHTGVSLGYNSSLKAFAVIAMLEGAYVSSGRYYAAHVFYTEEFVGGGDQIPGHSERLLGIGLMYGHTFEFTLSRPLFPLFPIPLLVKKETLFQTTFAVGASVVQSRLRNGPFRYIDTVEFPVINQDPEVRVVFGIPVQVEFTQMFTPSIGYVHRLYANINGARSIWTINWALQIGL
jgi:hypothetical protein